MRGADERSFSTLELKALIGEQLYGQLQRSPEVQPNPNIYPLPTIETTALVQSNAAVVIHTPHYIEDGFFIEVTADKSFEDLKEQFEQAGRSAKEKQRNDILEKAASAYSSLMGSSAFSYTSPVPTVAEHEAKAAQMDLAMLETKVKDLRNHIGACEGIDKLRQKIREEVKGNLLVASGVSRAGFDSLFESEQARIEEETSKMMLSLNERFDAIPKAVPLLQQILKVYVEALAARKTGQPAEKVVADAQKKLERLSANADEIIKKVDKLNNEIIYDRPTEERLEKAVLLIRAYNAIEAEFKSVTKEFEPFNVHFAVDLKDLPILQNVIKKALDNMEPKTEEKRTTVLSKFRRR